MNFEQRIQTFIECIEDTRGQDGNTNIRAAILLAHKKHQLNAADSDGGITSDQEAWLIALSRCDK